MSVILFICAILFFFQKYNNCYFIKEVLYAVKLRINTQPVNVFPGYTDPVIFKHLRY